MMDQSHSISIEGLNDVVEKWSNGSSKVGHLVFSLGQWCVIVAYQIPCIEHVKTHIQLSVLVTRRPSLTSILHLSSSRYPRISHFLTIQIVSACIQMYME